MHEVSRNDLSIAVTCDHDSTNLVRQSKLGEHDLLERTSLFLVGVDGCCWYERENFEGRLKWVGDIKLTRLDRPDRSPDKAVETDHRVDYDLLALTRALQYKVTV